MLIRGLDLLEPKVQSPIEHEDEDDDEDEIISSVDSWVSPMFRMAGGGKPLGIFCAANYSAAMLVD